MTQKSIEGLGAPELFNKPPHEFDAPSLDQPREIFEYNLRKEVKRLHEIISDDKNTKQLEAIGALHQALDHLADYDKRHGIEPRTEALYIPERDNDPHKGSQELDAVALYDQPIKTPTQEMPYGHEPWMGKPWQASPENVVE